MASFKQNTEKDKVVGEQIESQIEEIRNDVSSVLERVLYHNLLEIELTELAS